MRSNLLPLILIQTAMAFSILLIFYKSPIFPAFLSGDFSQHMTEARNIYLGLYPPFSSVILYGGIQYYLSLWVRFFLGDPLVAVREGMGLIVLLSVPIIYLTVKEIFDSKAALWTTAFYSLSGFLWFGTVFNSGLWPNFWGMLSSMILVSATLYFERKRRGGFRYLFLILAIVNALFSHYSVLLVFPFLMFYLVKKRLWKPFAMLSIPIIAGIPFASTLLAFVLSGSTGPSPSPLASYIPLPTLSAMVTEISANQIGDVAASSTLILGAYFFYRNWKTKDLRMDLISAWFLICLLLPVYNLGAWRFALIGLAPLTVMAGWSLSNLKPKRFVPGTKAAIFLLLFLTPTLGSSSNLSFWSNTHDGYQVASQQQADFQTIQWILSSLPSNCYHGNATNCGIIAANDLNFLYLPYLDPSPHLPPFGGFGVYYAPTYNVIYSDALQTQLFTSFYGRYIIVSKAGTTPTATCDPRLSFDLSLQADRTVVGVNQSVIFTLRGLTGLNATTTLFQDGIAVFKPEIQNGIAYVNATFPKTGSHILQLNLGEAMTTPLTITVVGSNPTLTAPQTEKVPSDFCQPWYSFNPATMKGWTVIYQNDFVRLYEVVK